MTAQVKRGVKLVVSDSLSHSKNTSPPGTLYEVTQEQPTKPKHTLTKTDDANSTKCISVFGAKLLMNPSRPTLFIVTSSARLSNTSYYFRSALCLC